MDLSPETVHSAISALEIADLVKRKRLKLPTSSDEFLELALDHHGVEEIPVDRDIALASAALPDHHNDPFDRLIIATASVHGLTLLSKDYRFQQYEAVTTVWS